MPGPEVASDRHAKLGAQLPFRGKYPVQRRGSGPTRTVETVARPGVWGNSFRVGFESTFLSIPWVHEREDSPKKGAGNLLKVLRCLEGNQLALAPSGAWVHLLDSVCCG